MTSKEAKFLNFDSRLGKFRHQGKLITAFEAERHAEEEIEQESGELTVGS